MSPGHPLPISLSWMNFTNKNNWSCHFMNFYSCRRRWKLQSAHNKLLLQRKQPEGNLDRSFGTEWEQGGWLPQGWKLFVELTPQCHQWAWSCQSAIQSYPSSVQQQHSGDVKTSRLHAASMQVCLRVHLSFQCATADFSLVLCILSWVPLLMDWSAASVVEMECVRSR